MFKMLIFLVILVASFTTLFFVTEDLQFFAALTAMCASAFGLLIVATHEHDKQLNLLEQSDLYDYSAE